MERAEPRGESWERPAMAGRLPGVPGRLGTKCHSVTGARARVLRPSFEFLCEGLGTPLVLTETQRVELTADLTRVDGAERCVPGRGWRGRRGMRRRFVKVHQFPQSVFRAPGKKERSVPMQFMGRISPPEPTSGPEPGSAAGAAGTRRNTSSIGSFPPVA